MSGNQRTVLITGASGQLGRRLVRTMVRHGYSVRAHYRSIAKADKHCPAEVSRVYGDLLETSWLSDAVKDADYVIHSAARVSVRPLSKTNTEYMYKVNVDGTRQVIEACKNAGVKRLVFISTVGAVGASYDDNPIDESAPFNLGGYGIPYFNTKHEAEMMALAASDEKLDVISLAPSIMISPPDRELTEKDLKKIHTRIPAYFDFGLNLVETEDVIEGIISALDNGKPGERYLLTGDNINPSKLFEIAKKYLGIKKPLIKIPFSLLYVIGAIAELLYLGKNKKPKLNRQIVRLTRLRFFYNCDKARRDLGYSYKPIEQTVENILHQINTEVPLP